MPEAAVPQAPDASPEQSDATEVHPARRRGRTALPLDGMNCIAYDGEVLVSMDAYGTEPFPKSSAAKLLQKQLDHIASPGEYV